MAVASSRSFSILPLFFRRLPLRSIFVFSPPTSITTSSFLHFRRSSHRSSLQSHPFKSEQIAISSSESSHGGSDSWPEFQEFSDWIDSSGYCRGPPGNGSEFVEEVNSEVFRVYEGCLKFARDYPDLLWNLSREDIQVVVDNGSPFLFKDAVSTTRRMKSFLGSGLNDVPGFDKPTTIDLMRFLLSYAHMAILSADKKPMINRVESSVRKLFGELAKSRRFYADSNASAQNQFSERYVQTSSFVQKTIEMKRGDWICPRCSFMNFARNSTCRECEEPRPKKHLTGGEWECPQCNFLNFGRNAVCLRCDCRKIGRNPSQSLTPALAVAAQNSPVKGQTVDKQENSNHLENPSNLGNNDFTAATSNINLEINQYLDRVLDGRSKSDITNIEDHLGESPQAKNQAEKSDEWFKKIAQLHDVEEDLTNAMPDEDFPETMPVRRGENRFVVTKKKDRSLTSPMYKRRMAMEQQKSGNDNKYVPFVPFPTGYFATDKCSNSGMEDNNTTKPRKSTDLSSSLEIPGNTDTSTNSGMEDDNKTTKPRKSTDFSSSLEIPGNTGTSSNSGMEDDNKTTKPRKSTDFSSSLEIPGNTGTSSNSGMEDNNKTAKPRKSTDFSSSLEGSAVGREPDPLDMSEEAKAERWFRRVAQIKDISELSQIPDEDFPSIMPMRKGVNRFVVSKRKTPLERRLTSSQYRRNITPAANSDPVNKENDSN